MYIDKLFALDYSKIKIKDVEDILSERKVDSNRIQKIVVENNKITQATDTNSYLYKNIENIIQYTDNNNYILYEALGDVPADKIKDLPVFGYCRKKDDNAFKCYFTPLFIGQDEPNFVKDIPFEKRKPITWGRFPALDTIDNKYESWRLQFAFYSLLEPSWCNIKFFEHNNSGINYKNIVKIDADLYRENDGWEYNRVYCFSQGSGAPSAPRVLKALYNEAHLFKIGPDEFTSYLDIIIEQFIKRKFNLPGIKFKEGCGYFMHSKEDAKMKIPLAKEIFNKKNFYVTFKKYLDFYKENNY
jgi:hypothetical protein